MKDLMLKVEEYVEKNIIKDKLYKVTEVSQIIGVKPPILRKWQNEFELKIPVDKQGRKFYTYQEIKVLLKIKELKITGADVQFITKIIKTSTDKSTNSIDGKKISEVKNEKTKSAKSNAVNGAIIKNTTDKTASNKIPLTNVIIDNKTIIKTAIDNTTFDKTPKDQSAEEEEQSQIARREELLLQRMLMRIYQRDEVIAKSYEEMLSGVKGNAKEELISLIKRHYEQLMADNSKLIEFIKAQRLAPKQEKTSWYQQIFS